MKNTGIVIWLALLTLYVGYQGFGLSLDHDQQNSNLEKRKAIFTNINERFEKIETFINEEIMSRIEHNEKYLHEH